jgi:hypothetical protein
MDGRLFQGYGKALSSGSSTVETLIVVIPALVAAAISTCHSLPLPSIPHNSNLPWMGGDVPFVGQTFQETGLMTRALEMTDQKLGPIFQVSCK